MKIEKIVSNLENLHDKIEFFKISKIIIINSTTMTHICYFIGSRVSTTSSKKKYFDKFKILIGTDIISCKIEI